ncbi:MAG: hypothetical protein AB7F23_04285 [Phycisphaerae bacterium]|jgi:hypothetical protein
MLKHLAILLLTGACVYAVNTKELDDVRAKDSFATADNAVVERFLTDSFGEMLNAKNLSEVINVADIITLRLPKAEQTDYKSAFTAALKTEIEKVMARVDGWEDQRFAAGFKIVMANIAYKLDDAAFLTLAAELTASEQVSSRYWGLKLALEAAPLAEIKAGSENGKALTDAVALQAESETSSIVMMYMAELASKIADADADRILASLMKSRIAQYKSGKTSFESFDAGLLKSAAARIKAGNNELKEPFAQIFAFAAQRYIYSLEDGNDISEQAKIQLGAMISETVKNVLPVLEINGESLLKAMERRNFQQATDEYKSLFDTIAQKLAISYASGEPEKLDIGN